MNRVYAGIDVMSCVQGNTVRKIYRDENYSAGCVVYDFEHRTAEETARSRQEAYEEASVKRIGRRAAQRRKAARARARRVQSIRLALCGVLLAVVFSIGGIASKAKSKEVPDAYKYYDTITVAYQENLLDIVQRYDNRAYYETQKDYVEELCRINNIAFDGTEYPDVTPGTHLVVPYYDTVLK